MKIEIAEPGRMTQSGSSLLKLIQNNKTPVLDLLVRESLQNSLDAHKEDVKSVTVEYLTGDFSSSALGDELEGIGSALKKRFSVDRCQYLAVCDSDTVGLTGEMDVQNVKDNQYGNLLKLVYEICKPQEAEGAGGSWGLGKTVYFRIGIGLVIYYSRIEDGTGNYSSRLAASFVEDENSPDAIIPEYNGMIRRGIAWWGDEIRENTTIPVTDEEYIRKFLGIFNIDPYEGNKTGTAIIIPYVNPEMLLENNRIDYTDALDEHLLPYWYSSLENYLRIAVQRWYAPRLCNPKYPYGAFLKVLINGEGISADSMEPVFKTVQTLYNRATYCNEKDFLSDNGISSPVSKIKINKFLDDSIAGNVACVKIPGNILGMDPPHNKPEPSVYFNCDITDKTSNRPLIFFVRKPGMIVAYENVSEWTVGIPSTSKSEYIFGIFVLSSLNTFKNSAGPVDSLEEYIRKSEMADHTSWNDWSHAGFNPRIVSKIQKGVTKAIGSEYAADDIEHKTKENSELSRFIGDIILPPDGFGKGANASPKNSGNGTGKKGQKKFSFAVIADKIKYRTDKMIVPMELKTAGNKQITHTAFEMKIATENGKISMIEWMDELKLTEPFSIEALEVMIDMLDGEKVNYSFLLNDCDSTEKYKDIVFTLRCVHNSIFYGLDITSDSEHSMKIEMNAVVRLNKKNVRPVFTFEKEAT